MPDIAVQKKNENVVAPATRREPDPFRLMRDLFRWDPFREMAPIWSEGAAVFAPAFEVKETKEAFLFKADLPGIKESDLQVTITGNRLSVSGHREQEKQEKDDTYYTYERSYGSFSRAFTLPEGADTAHVRADLKEGVLTVAVPKIPAAVAKHIEVKTGDKPKS